ncbi:pyridoxal-phosphate dependent enzyme [Rhodovulum sp. DZ06]|uniref:pyridoxal-phosphate dependent enzyme n=1 Tax=Rhodovulum sp. DZ06 TaxID=3425126 RepID=UPI003D3518DA
MTGFAPPTAPDAAASLDRLRGIAGGTPLRPWPRLSERLGREVRVKREDLAPGGAMFRGAANAALCASPGAQSQDLVCASAGPFAEAVAAMAARLQVRAVLVLPEGAPAPDAPGAGIRRHGATLAAAREEAARLARVEGLRLLDPASPAAIAGSAGAALECLGEWPELSGIVAPACSGALCAGLALGLRGAGSAALLTAAALQAGPSLRATLTAAAPDATPPGADAPWPLRAAVTPEAPAAFMLLSAGMNAFTDLSGAELAAAEVFLAEPDPDAPAPGKGTALALAALMFREERLFGPRPVLLASGG